MKRWQLFVFSLIATLALRTTSFSYGKTWMGANLELLVRQATSKVGPFRVQTTLIISDAGYDSNVYRTAANPIKDYSVTGGPAFHIYLPIKKKVVISVYESAQYVYFFETKRERTWNNYLTGQADFVFKKIFLSAAAGLSVAREIWNTEIDIRPRRTERSLKGEALWQASPKTSFQLSFKEAKLDYEDLSLGNADIRETLNRTEQYLSGSLYWRLTGKIRGGFEYELGRFDFQNPGSHRNSESRAIYGKIDLSSISTIIGRVRIGMKEFKLRSSALASFRGIAGDADVTIRFGSGMKLRGSYARDIQFSAWIGYAYFIENRVGVGASVYPFQRIRFDYDYFTGRNLYPSRSLTGEIPIIERNDQNKIHRIGIYYRIKDKVGIGLTMNWWRRASSLTWFNGKREFVGANLIYDF
jgi:hypothetical protein